MPKRKRSTVPSFTKRGWMQIFQKSIDEMQRLFFGLGGWEYLPSIINLNVAVCHDCLDSIAADWDYCYENCDTRGRYYFLSDMEYIGKTDKGGAKPLRLPQYLR